MYSNFVNEVHVAIRWTSPFIEIYISVEFSLHAHALHTFCYNVGSDTVYISSTHGVLTFELIHEMPRQAKRDVKTISFMGRSATCIQQSTDEIFQK